MALSEPLKPARSEIVITSWVTWPSAAAPLNEGFSFSVESEHLDLQNLRTCPKLHSTSQVWNHLCCTIRPVGSTRKAGSGFSQVPHREMTPKVRADSDKFFLARVTSYGSQLRWFGCGSGWKTPKFLSVCSQKLCLGWICEVCSAPQEWVICSSKCTNKQTNKNRNGKKIWAVPSAMGLISLSFLWLCDFNLSTHVDLMRFHKSWSPASTFLSGHPFIFSLTL